MAKINGAMQNKMGNVIHKTWSNNGLEKMEKQMTIEVVKNKINSEIPTMQAKNKLISVSKS